MKNSKSFMQKVRLGEANFLLLEEVKQLISDECDNYSEEFLTNYGFIKLSKATSLKIRDIQRNENRKLFIFLTEWLKEWGWYLHLYEFSFFILEPIP